MYLWDFQARILLIADMTSLQFYLVLFYIIVIGPDILFHAATLIMLQKTLTPSLL